LNGRDEELVRSSGKGTGRKWANAICRTGVLGFPVVTDTIGIAGRGAVMRTILKSLPCTTDVVVVADGTYGTILGT
jgi:hypothetical protein